MSPSDELDADVLTGIERSFDADERDLVLDAMRQARRPSRLPILLLANGDAAQVEALLKWDLLDWREIPARFQALQAREGPDLPERYRKLGLAVPSPRERIEADVKRFIAEWFVRRPEQIQGGLQLQADLGLSAAPDGPRFVRAFAEKFGVDIRSFRLDRHFHAREWDGLLAELLRFIFRRPRRTLVPITVGDLIAAAETKRFGANGG